MAVLDFRKKIEKALVQLSPFASAPIDQTFSEFSMGQIGDVTFAYASYDPERRRKYQIKIGGPNGALCSPYDE